MDVDSIDSLSSAQSSSASQPPRKIITVIHKETTLPGQVGHQLEKMGYELEIRAPIFGDALPTCFEQYAGALVFGGPMSVNDDEPYLHQEMDWIRQVLAAGLPYLGICLGAQLLAKVLGADVNRHENAVEEIGYYPIFATEEGQSLFSDRMEVYQWHNEGFELPEGAVRLASGKDFPNQAFRWGDRTYAIQFHPEMTADMVDFWTTAGADLLGAPNAQSRCQHILGHQKHGGAVNRWLETFLNNWLTDAA